MSHGFLFDKRTGNSGIYFEQADFELLYLSFINLCRFLLLAQLHNLITCF